MRVTVIPDDQTIIIDGVALTFAFSADTNIHAIQWDGGFGRVEHKTGDPVVFDDVATIQPYVDAYDAEVARRAAIPPVPPNIRAEILNVSQQALGSGFLHMMMFDMMQRYLAAAQAIVPTVTEADLLNPESEYYNHAYVETKQYYDQLKALQDLK